MEFGYDGKHGPYQLHLVRAPAALLHLLLLWVPLLQPLLLFLPVALLL
jgi:hypothetical protein